MSGKREVVITAARRTPVGAFLGALSAVTAPQLGALVIRALVDETGIPSGQVDEVIMGNVLPAGLGQAPARQAALAAGLPDSVECLTINKMCGSGLKAVMLAAQAISSGGADIIIAGGMESMSNVPFLLPEARRGYRLGHGQIQDSMIRDGLWDVYNDIHMGSCAELCAREKKYTRERQDVYAQSSYTRARKAQHEGYFEAEIVPVEVPQRRGPAIRVVDDEEPGKANFEKMSTLRPAFEEGGTITAANASKINDGAAAVLVMSAEAAAHSGLAPKARIVAQASAAQAPEWFTTAPVAAIRKVLEKAELTPEQVGLWEINEAFAPVVLAAMEAFSLPPEKVNVHGGAIALGHPIGASGARILVTLLYALERYNVPIGLATLCIGGGEGSALIVEKL